MAALRTVKPTASDPGRREALALLGGAMVLAASPRQAMALTTDEARALIDQVVADLNSIINSGASQSTMIRRFEGLFARYADVPTIARSTLGADARRATPAQLRAFSDAFKGYMARKYGKRFREFIGGQITVTSAKPVKSFFEVRSTVKLRGQSPFTVAWLVSDKSGRNKFFDMIIEGISLLKTERTEIGALLDSVRGDIDAMIARLRQMG